MEILQDGINSRNLKVEHSIICTPTHYTSMSNSVLGHLNLAALWFWTVSRFQKFTPDMLTEIHILGIIALGDSGLRLVTTLASGLTLHQRALMILEESQHIVEDQFSMQVAVD